MNYGVSLYYSISPCYDVSPCNVTFAWVTRPEHTGRSQEAQRATSWKSGPGGSPTLIVAIYCRSQDRYFKSIILQNTYKPPQKQLFVRMAQIFLTFVLYILVATTKCSFSEAWIYKGIAMNDGKTSSKVQIISLTFYQNQISAYLPKPWVRKYDFPAVVTNFSLMALGCLLFIF